MKIAADSEIWDESRGHECTDKPRETLDRAQPVGQRELPSLGPRSLATLPKRPPWPSTSSSTTAYYGLNCQLPVALGTQTRPISGPPCQESRWQWLGHQCWVLTGMNADVTPLALCPLTGSSCICLCSGGSVKGRDELPGAVMCSKGTQVRTATTFSFFSPGDCGVIPGEVGHKHVAGGGGLVKRAAALLRRPGPLLGPFCHL